MKRKFHLCKYFRINLHLVWIIVRIPTKYYLKFIASEMKLLKIILNDVHRLFFFGLRIRTVFHHDTYEKSLSKYVHMKFGFCNTSDASTFTIVLHKHYFVLCIVNTFVSRNALFFNKMEKDIWNHFSIGNFRDTWLNWTKIMQCSSSFFFILLLLTSFTLNVNETSSGANIENSYGVSTFGTDAFYLHFTHELPFTHAFFAGVNTFLSILNSDNFPNK